MGLGRVRGREKEVCGGGYFVGNGEGRPMAWLNREECKRGGFPVCSAEHRSHSVWWREMAGGHVEMMRALPA